MAVLACKFADKLRFYDEVLLNASPRLFVATASDVPTGTNVQLEILFGGEVEALLTEGKVVARVTEHGSGAAGKGVWVQLKQLNVEALKQAMHFDWTDVPFLTARAHPRIHCGALVHIQEPSTMTVRCGDISLRGVCLEGVSNLRAGQLVRMTIDFDLGAVGAHGQVAWVDGKRVGVAFNFSDAGTRQVVHDHIRRLFSGEAAVANDKPSILMVNDDPSALTALDRALEAHGYTALVASTGPDAIRVARQQRPTIIFLDALLYGMNGVEVCRVLKRDAGTSQIPVVLTSALPSAELAPLLKESGALAALNVPYKIEDLTELAGKILDHNQILLAGGAVPESAPSRRSGDRSPMFVRADFENDNVFLRGHLADASTAGVFFIGYWGDATGSTGKLTLPDEIGHALEVGVEVRRRSDWGIVPNPACDNLPGFGLRITGGAGQREFVDWLEARKRHADVRPVILLVDDDRPHLEIISVVLRYAGFGVVALDSPVAVANAVRSAKPALVMMDYLTPGPEFSLLCDTIRKAAQNDEIPIWLHSSITDGHFQKVAATAGLTGWVPKTTRPTDVAARIADFLGTTLILPPPES